MCRRPPLIRHGASRALAILATGVLLATLGPGPTRASAASRHDRPAPTQPGPPAPTQTAPPSTPEPQTRDDALRAAAALARATATLVALGAFGPASGSAIARAVLPAAPAAGSTRAQLIADLQESEAEEPALAASLVGDGVQLDPDVVHALTPLSPAEEEAVAAGQQVSVAADVDLRALASLVNDEGWPPSGPSPPTDATEIAAALPEALALAAPTPAATPTATPSAQATASPSAAPTEPPSHARAAAAAIQPATTGVGTATPWLIAALATLAALFALIVPRRRREARRPAAPPRLEDLLEISRRLDTEDTSASIDRAVIREVTRVIPSHAAAVVARREGQWLVAEETEPGLIRAEGLGEGLIGRAADTGQLTVAVSASEPALARLPVALAVVPLAAGGVVASVLVLVRPAARVFTDAERDVLVAAGPAVAAAMERARQARAALSESLRDPLTGAGNRRGFDTALARVLDQDGGRASLIMVDLDHFKRVNDTHGHPAGDAVLRGVVELMRRTLGPHEGIYRYGGEEFCVLLPETPLDEARLLAERLRSGVEAHDFILGTGTHLRATASLGIATANGDGAQGLVARADAALYGAKTSGRNRVCTG